MTETTNAQGIKIGSEKQIKWAEEIKDKLLNSGLDFSLVDRVFTELHHDHLTRVQFVKASFIMSLPELAIGTDARKNFNRALKDNSSGTIEQVNIFFDNFDMVDLINNVEDASLFIKYRYTLPCTNHAVFTLLLAVVYYNLAKRLGISVYTSDSKYEPIDYDIRYTAPNKYTYEYNQLLKM